MLSRLKLLWATVRDGLWFIPASFTLAAIGVAVLLVHLEQTYEWELAKAEIWLLGGGADGARHVLSTIAGSLITVTGVAFSVNIVALQLASSQFTPRILRNFTADRSNQYVLGVLISTFTYTLIVLRVIRSKLENSDEFVPHLAVALAIVMALVSVGFLIHFIHHSARSMQASVILSRVTAEALEHLKRLFPEDMGSPEQTAPVEAIMAARLPELVEAEKEGYLQAIDSATLFELGERHELLIRMSVPVGAFIARGEIVAEVWSAEPCDDQIKHTVRSSFLVGQERTPGQDFEFFLLEISDMAVKALSPGINDPTTALHCIDRLTQILLAFGRRKPPAAARSAAGGVHFLALHTTLAGAVELSFDQIIHFGHDNPLIVAKLNASTNQLLRLLPEDRREPVRQMRKKLDAAVLAEAGA